MTDQHAGWNHDVVAIGNALVDVLSHETEAFVSAEGLNKGAMTLIDESRAHTLYDSMGPGIEISGGARPTRSWGWLPLGVRLRT